MSTGNNVEIFDTIVVGGGQAGLAVGYHLAKGGHDFVIIDANDRVGDSWRKRWDSLRLFTPSKYSSLPGMPFSTTAASYLTKDETADYLGTYAAHFDLPVRLGTVVDSVSPHGDRYIVGAGAHRFEANNVVVATGAYQRPKVPLFASGLNSMILQMHSSEYRNPDQMNDGDVLVVGVGNSGAEIALELKDTRRTLLSGRETGRIPTPPNFLGGVYWWLISYVLNVDSRIGRRFRSRSQNRGAPLIGTSAEDFDRGGVERVPRVAGVKDGKPVLEDNRVLDVKNVVWCTGFAPDFSWISLPVFGENGYPNHHRGVVDGAPGLYFVGLPFLYTLSSSLLGGVGRDAEYIANQIGAEHNCHDSPSVTGTERMPEAIKP